MGKDKREGWLAELTAGSAVIVGNLVAEVDRVTPTGRIVVGHQTYSAIGKPMGADSWTVVWLREATPEAVMRIQQKGKARKARAMAAAAARRYDWPVEHADRLLELATELDELTK